MLNSISQISKELKITEEQINEVMKMLKEGATIPFIARYRKNSTGGLDEEQLELINNRFTYVIELNKRKEAIIKILQEKELLTKELEIAILNAKTKNELEEIYEPYKEGKKTKATKAIALGLKPLAEKILYTDDSYFNPYKEAEQYLSDKVESVDFAIEQSQLIIAELMAKDLKARELVYNQLLEYSFLVTKKKRTAKDEGGKFENYYSFKQRIRQIPNFRILAINRGESLKVLSWDIEYNDKKVKYDLNNHFFKIKSTGKILLTTLEDALKRLIIPSIKRKIWNEKFEKADVESIALFARNLEDLLLSPSIKNKRVIAIDPGFVSGCKVAALDEMGKVLAIDVIKPHPPFKKIEQSSELINNLIEKFNINLIVIGNGTASRETEIFIAELNKKRKTIIQFIIVSEVGASVYSASKIAIKEFPDLSVEKRSAIHIGRKFQDPLNELVKIDPKAIGVGQYQHDLNQKELQNALAFKVNKVVNQVGVDLNNATGEILSYISGLSKTVASNIIKYRIENGSFKNRLDLKKIKGLGKKSFEQSIGFLRINNSNNFYDKTAIHPESYKLADQIVKLLKIDLNNIEHSKLNIDNSEISKKLDSNKYDVELIINSLKEPGKDIRDEKPSPKLKSDVLKISDLNVGMHLEGEVQNITDFGIFVYIGLKEAAFIHISKLASKFVNHPSEIVKTNEHVNIEIIEIDTEKKKIKAKLLLNN